MKLLGLLVLMLSLGVFASEDGHKMKDMKHKKDHQKMGKDMTITGSLIGLTCFVKHGEIGPKHADCFKSCAAKGLPIGILTKDNVIYQISGKGHADQAAVNAPLLKYAESNVKVKGQVFEKMGVKFIVVTGIKKN